MGWCHLALIAHFSPPLIRLQILISPSFQVNLLFRPPKFTQQWNKPEEIMTFRPDIP